MAHRVSADGGKEGVFSPDGTRIAYVRGPGAWYRKGYRGSANDDVWVCDADGSHNRQLTNFDGQDASPMWSADGKWIYYVSEFYGTPANIVRMPSTPVGNADASTVTAAPPQQITFHKDDAVRRARISANGDWIVYECGADLWVVSTKEGSAAAQAGHRGQRRRQGQSRTSGNLHEPCDRVRRVARREARRLRRPRQAVPDADRRHAQGGAADRRPVDGPRRRLGAGRQPRPVRLRPRRPRGHLRPRLRRRRPPQARSRPTSSRSRS